MFRSVAPIASTSSNFAGNTFVTTGRIQGIPFLLQKKQEMTHLNALPTKSHDSYKSWLSCQVTNLRNRKRRTVRIRNGRTVELTLYLPRKAHRTLVHLMKIFLSQRYHYAFREVVHGNRISITCLTIHHSNLLVAELLPSKCTS
jgi:hypothetical protein